MVAIMNEALRLKVGLKVLEVGSGCGWHASTIAETVAPGYISNSKWGHVYTMEILPEVADLARRNIERAGYSDRITVICGDGSKGWSDKSPFDRISVTAAAPNVPTPLKEQLKKGGIILIPVGPVGFLQKLKRIIKNGKYLTEDLGGVAFVPLRGKYGH